MDTGGGQCSKALLPPRARGCVCVCAKETLTRGAAVLDSHVIRRCTDFFMLLVCAIICGASAPVCGGGGGRATRGGASW